MEMHMMISYCIRLKRISQETKTVIVECQEKFLLAAWQLAHNTLNEITESQCIGAANQLTQSWFLGFTKHSEVSAYSTLRSFSAAMPGWQSIACSALPFSDLGRHWLDRRSSLPWSFSAVQKQISTPPYSPATKCAFLRGSGQFLDAPGSLNQ
jgi:hypothetical protein